MTSKFLRQTGICLTLLLARSGYSQQAPPACPSPALGAFTGCYYSNQTLSGNPSLVRTDAQINFDWGNESPAPSLQPQNFSAFWQGDFDFDAGQYTFSITASDGLRVYLDGTLILNAWRMQPPSYYAAAATVSAGTHLIAVQYYDADTGATAQVSWKNSAPAAPQSPSISSFAASPASVAPGQPTILSWSTSGATALSLNNGIGNVTGKSSLMVFPGQSETWTLTASNGASSVSANATVSVTQGGSAPQPSPPTLLSAVAKSGNQIDLLWTASSDPSGVAGYQIIRNGSMISSVPGNLLVYDDNSASPGTTYTYTIVAFDAAGNRSAPGNAVQVSTPAAAAPPGSCPGPATNAYTGCYYPNVTLSGNPSFVRTDPQLNFDWGNASPDRSLPPLNFSALWQGNFTFAQGNYTFNLIASDGMRIYIDGAIVFSQWIDQSPNAFTFSRQIGAGTHLVTVQYFEQTGGATAQVSWKLASVSPPPAYQAPVISSFTANPSTTTAGAPVTLSWSVSGATSIGIGGIGDVTGVSGTTVDPSVTTVYTLTASNAAGAVSAALTVNVSSGSGSAGSGGGGTETPSTPELVSGTAKSSGEVDLVWTASSDSLGISSYQILRNGFPLASVGGSVLTYADTSVSGSETFGYSVKAYDPAGNYSAPSNIIQVTTPSPAGVSVTWYGGCWINTTVYGITGNYQAVVFNLVSPAPVAIQGTLFDGLNCTASGGDNLNDFDSPTNPGQRTIGFSHNANVQPVSAMYWVGGSTSDGRCPAGSTTCSGCFNYNSATLSCSVLP